jgi:metal transporter CNNM
MDYLIVLVLVFFSALFSGLTLGFFSLNKDDLKRRAKLGDKRALKVYNLRENGNLLLCTFLIGNVSVNAILAVFLSSIASSFFAGLLSTGLIVIFGEIIPQATFSRYALFLGYKLAWLVVILKYVFLPVSWPIAKFLDKILGEELPTVYTRSELMKLIEEHEDMTESDLDEDEERIIKGALSFSEKKVEQIMTPRTEVFALQEDKLFDVELIKNLFDRGHSRIPVYKTNRDDIAGILYVKDLIANNYKDKTVGDLARKNVIFVDHDKPLDELLNAFKKHRHHLFIVVNDFGGVSGIVTIEDVIEEIIGSEIVDEYDKFSDLQAVAREKMEKKRLRKA